jgi:CheY-like chemotaxis protein
MSIPGEMSFMDAQFPILIAEDDENDAIILQQALRKVGFTNPFHFCRDGTEVVSYLRREGIYADRDAFPFPRILITDLKMPKMNGIEVLKWLHSHPECNLIPKIVLTASKQAADIKAAYQWGANSYLVKPAGYQRLTEILRIFFDYWKMCEKPQLPVKC